MRKIILSKIWPNKFFLTALALAFFLISCGSALAQEQYIQVHGQVGGVIAGPSTEDTEDDDDEDKDDSSKKNPISFAAQPTVSVEPDNAQGAIFNLVAGMPQFVTARPAFKGQTNIQNAEITLIFSFNQFSLRATTQADAAGNWHFISSENFPTGIFHLTVLATHPEEPAIKAEIKTQFQVLTDQGIFPWSERSIKSSLADLFSVYVRIQDSYKVIAPGEDIIASIKLVNFNNASDPVEVEVEYGIYDEFGRELLRNQEVVTMRNELLYFKTFYTQPDMKEGTYQLVVKVLSQNALSLGTTNFTIKGKSGIVVTSLAKIDYTTITTGLIGASFIFVLLSYFEFIRFLSVKKSIRFVTSRVFKKFF